MNAEQKTVTCAEAPASWNVRYMSPDGFSCQFTLRGSSGADLLPRTVAALQWLADHGCTPNGTPVATANSNHAGNPAWCPIHNCEMKRREKDGQTWYSHKTADGEWCRGKAPKGGVGG